MESHRWQCRELNAYDLMPDRNLINFFITSPKAPDVNSEFQQFKTQQTRSRKHILFKYQPAQVRQRDLLISEGPRFSKELPMPIEVSLLRAKPSRKKIIQGPNNEAEVLIEEMIRNRQEISLPSIARVTSPCSNIKERFSKTKTVLHEKSGTLLQNIKESIRSKSYKIESEMSYWDKQPMRKWDSRPSRILNQNRFKSQLKPLPSILENEENLQGKLSHIDNILDSCCIDISNWKHN